MKRIRLLALLVAMPLLLAALAGEARADGMPFPKITAGDLEVRATAQRAVVWLRNGTWEVHIQPVFDREQTGAAWVVPWPVQPIIHAGNADLFDQLELITSPAFLEYCMPADTGGGGCGTKYAGDNGGFDTKSAEGSVVIWDRGTVGQLDYVVLSAGDGDDLVTWLETNEYAVSADAAAAITVFEIEEQFFFVATLSPDADPALPHVPVRFVLPDLVDGTYPLRLTGLAVPPGEALDLTLWVIAPTEGYSQSYLPLTHSYSIPEGQPRNRDAFDANLTAFFADNGADHLALLYSLDVSNDLLGDTRCVENYTSPGPGYACVSYSELGITPPAVWAPEMQAVRDGGGWLQRYQGRMDALAMTEDLVFVQSTESMPVKGPFYYHDTGTCPSEDDEYVGCSVARPFRHASWFLLTAAVLLLLGLGVFRRLR